MHERSIVRQLLLQIEKLMNVHNAQHVSTVRVSVGDFSGVEPMLLRSAFDEMAECSRVCGAELIVDTVRLEATCDSCGCEFIVEQFRFRCPACGGRGVTILRGEELMLETVEMGGD